MILKSCHRILLHLWCAVILVSVSLCTCIYVDICIYTVKTNQGVSLTFWSDLSNLSFPFLLLIGSNQTLEEDQIR